MINKILCVIVAVIVMFFSVVCVLPLPARADDIGLFYDAQQFMENFTEQMEQVTHNAAEAINDSNMSQSQKQAILKVLAMQEIALHSMNLSYGNGNLPSGDTVTVSGSCYTGFYYYNNELKSGILYPLPTVLSEIPTTYTLYSCPDFQISYTATPNNLNVPFQGYTTFYNNGIVSNYLDFGVENNRHQSGNITISSVEPFRMTYGSITQFNNKESTSIRLWLASGYIPTITTNTRVVDTNNYTGDPILGNGSQVTIPSATVDSTSPWDYYNNDLLPQIRTDFPDVPDIYICYPQGYTNQDPVEPATMPNGGIGVQNNWNFNIGVNIIYPTDASGQPVTDASGETVTETEIITETRPSDAVYNFQIPTLPQLETVDNSIPLEQNVPEHYATLLAGFFNLIDGFLTDSGVKPILPFLFTIGIITFVIYRLS